MVYLILCFSPHLDDAILSCSAKFLADKRAGKSLQVDTIFSEGGENKSRWSKFNYLDRRAEDRRALERVGSEVNHWQLLDAPFRSSSYSDWLKIVTHFDQSDDATIDEIKSRMWRVIEEKTPSEILIPFGIGGHIDHRLVFAAGLELCHERNLWDEMIFYEDRPYVLIEQALRLRFYSLGLKKISWVSFLNLIPSYATGLMNSEMVRSQTSGIPARCYLVVAALLNAIELGRMKINIPNLTPAVVTARGQDIDEIASLVQEYSSQFKDLYGSEENFLNQSFKYSLHLGVRPGLYVERYWRGSVHLHENENT